MDTITLTISSRTISQLYAVVLLVGIITLFSPLVSAATPNPGHPWVEVGDGTFQVTGPTALRTYAYPDANATMLTSASLVTVPQGGTGWGNLQANTVLLGNGTGAIATTSAGTNGYVLTFSGGVPTWIATTTLANISGLLGLSNGGTGAALTANNGGIVYSDASSLQILAGTSTAGRMLQSGAAAAPTWTVATYPATAGTAGFFLTSDGTNWNSAVLTGALASTTAITTGTTFTTAANTHTIFVRLVGGGGGGGGATGAFGSTGISGGGGSGGYAEKTFTVTPSTAYTIAIGAAGAAGTALGNGGTGGNTTITVSGTTVTAFGGLGGVRLASGAGNAMTLGGAGGAVSTNGDLNEPGNPGGWGYRVSGTVAVSGIGAASTLGSGGNSRNTSGNGNAAGNYGAGGGGAASINTTTGYTGGAGTAGVILITEYK